MANSAGIYLRLEGKILLLCDKAWGQVPIGIGIPDFAENAKTLALRPGDPVQSREGCLHFAAGWIKIAETGNEAPSYGRKAEKEALQRGFEALRGRETGLAPLVWQKNRNPLCTLAAPRLEKLFRSLREEDASGIDAGVESLLGLGPGLTPSADDVLCGLLYGLQRSIAKKAVTCLKNAVRKHSGRTHPVSAAYLHAIAEGEFFSRMDGVWQYLTGEGPDCLEALLEVGSSSGADMLLGLLLAGTLLRMEEWTNV